jgi:phage terminase large subunit GpA-like protein
LTGANSATGLRSTPCRYIFLDEVDAFPSDVDGEGDPVTLAEKAETTFSRRKIFMTSTPTVKDFSRIEAEYELSDQRRFYVPCPCCSGMQWLKWTQLKYQDNDPVTAPTSARCAMSGSQRTTRRGCCRRASGGQRHRQWQDGWLSHLSGLYSPLGLEAGPTWWRTSCAPRAMRRWLKTWVNTVLGETWEEDFASKVSADGLLDRCEHYEAAMVPEGGLALTVGVDVQDNRLAISVWAWGREEEGWLLDHQEIYGDPSRQELWKQLDEVVLREWPHAVGPAMRPDVVAIDSGGHFTAEVYQYARERARQGVVAIKGQSQRGKPPIGKGSKVDVNHQGRTLKRGAVVYLVGGDTVKTTLFGRLKHNEQGAGFLHFHMGTTGEYFEQLTAEKQVLRYNRGGFPTREWVKKPSARNEALDCLVYAYAALNLMYQRFDRRTIWDQLEKRLEGTGKKKKPALLGSKQQPPSGATGFVGNW